MLDVSLDAVAKAFGKLDPWGAAGLDTICPWMLKFGGDEVVVALQRLFSVMWRKCLIPADWKRALVVPIFKKGDPSDPGNYRPISLLCVAGKVLSRIMNDALYNKLEKEGLLPDEQGGFRTGQRAPEMILGLSSLC